MNPKHLFLQSLSKIFSKNFPSRRAFEKKSGAHLYIDIRRSRDEDGEGQGCEVAEAEDAAEDGETEGEEEEEGGRRSWLTQ